MRLPSLDARRHPIQKGRGGAEIELEGRKEIVCRPIIIDTIREHAVGFCEPPTDLFASLAKPVVRLDPDPRAIARPQATGGKGQSGGDRDKHRFLRDWKERRRIRCLVGPGPDLALKRRPLGGFGGRVDENNHVAEDRRQNLTRLVLLDAFDDLVAEPRRQHVAAQTVADHQHAIVALGVGPVARFRRKDRLNRAQRRDRGRRDLFADRLSIEQRCAGRKTADEAADRFAELLFEAKLIDPGAAPADVDRGDLGVAVKMLALATLRQEARRVCGIQAEIGDILIADPGIVAPAVDEDDDVVRSRRKVLLQRVQLRDDGLERRIRGVRAERRRHRRLQHRARHRMVAVAFVPQQGIGLAVLAKFEEAEREIDGFMTG